jgi:predicted short-subunit dehydrogenase-like oxidoreductase (DUF2520 family)
MSEKVKKKIAIIGCGAVAWHLAEKFRRHELYVYNHKANAVLTAYKNIYSAQVFPNLKKVIKDADLYFICIKDKHITDVLNTLSYLPPASVICISSGNYNLKDYKGKLKNIGILYPLQTFSKEDEIKWKDITMVTDALNKTALSDVNRIAHLLSENVIALNYEQRLKLHLAAVLANNFTNSLYTETEKLLKSIDASYTIQLFYPLLKQSIKKLKYISPLEAQTGPAKRNDKQVMAKHQDLLKNQPELMEIYKLISNLIMMQQKINS